MPVVIQIWLNCMRSAWSDCIEMDQLEGKSAISDVLSVRSPSAFFKLQAWSELLLAWF